MAPIRMLPCQLTRKLFGFEDNQLLISLQVLNMQWLLTLDTHSLPVFELSNLAYHLNQPKSRSKIEICVIPFKRLFELDHGLNVLTVLTSYPKVKQGSWWFLQRHLS